MPFYVKNLSNPQPSAHDAGTYFSAPSNALQAVQAYAALYPVAAGDVVRTLNAVYLEHYAVTVTPTYGTETPPAGSVPPPPANGT